MKIPGERCAFHVCVCVCVCVYARARTQAPRTSGSAVGRAFESVSGLAFALFLMPARFCSTEAGPRPGSRVHPGGPRGRCWASGPARPASPGSAPRDLRGPASPAGPLGGKWASWRLVGCPPRLHALPSFPVSRAVCWFPLQQEKAMGRSSRETEDSKIHREGRPSWGWCVWGGNGRRGSRKGLS